MSAEVITPQQIGAYAYQLGYSLVPVSAEDAAVLRAMGKTWDKIMEQDSLVPAAVFDLTPGRSSSCISVGWDLQPVIALNLRPDGRKVTAPEVLQYLLHQAAHSIAKSVKGQEGRYHGPAYKKAATALGLEAVKDPTGYGATSLATGTRTRYRNELVSLDRALSRWEPTPQVKAIRSSRNGVVLECSCTPPRKIRLRGDPAKIDVTGIRCEICGKPFSASDSST